MIDERAVTRLLGMRYGHWPADWPLPTGAQFVALRALLKARPDAFVAAVNPPSREYRVVVLTRKPIGHGLDAREYALLPDGRLRYVTPGEPYHHRKDEPHAA